MTMNELTIEEMNATNGAGRYRSYIYYSTGGQATVGYESVPWDAPYTQAEINEMTGKLQSFVQQHAYQEPYNSGNQYDTSGWHLSFFTNIDEYGDLPRFPTLNIKQQAQIAQDAFRLKNGLNPMGAKGFIPSYTDLADAIGLGQP